MAEVLRGAPDPGPQQKTLKRGGRRRTRQPEAENTVAIIDRLLLTPIKVTQKGTRAKITALEAIMHRLLQQEIEGNSRASRVLRKYRQLVRRKDERRPQVVFADASPARSPANIQPRCSNA